jgi:hypothetical protein
MAAVVIHISLGLRLSPWSPAPRHLRHGNNRKGKGVAMRPTSYISCTVVLLAASASAGVDVLYSNGPIEPELDPSGLLVRDGLFSDAYGSDGTYFYSASAAQSFTIDAGDAWQFSAIRFWGASEYLENPNPISQTALSANVSAIEVVVLRVNEDPEDTRFPVVHQWTLPIGNITQTLTGTYVPNIFSPVFQLDAQLNGNVVLGAGNYIVSIGGVLVNGDLSSFAWIDGERDGTDPEYLAWGTQGGGPGEWGIWSPQSNGFSGAVEIYGNEIPAPGAIALLAVVGASGFGRRRRA